MTTTWRYRRGLPAMALGTALVLAACGGGGDGEKASSDRPTTEAPTTTAAPTTTEAVTTTEAPPTTAATDATPPSTEDEGSLVSYSFSDDFTTDSGWLIGCNDGVGCALVDDGRLAEAIDAGQVEIDQHSEWDGLFLTNVAMHAEVLDFGEGNPEAGPICHYDPDAGAYYDFTVGADGMGSLYKFTSPGRGEPLAGPVEVPIFTASYEQIDATCATEADGSVHLTMTFNGEVVADVVDDTDPLPPGQVGLVTYGDTDQDSSISFDNVEVGADRFIP